MNIHERLEDLQKRRAESALGGGPHRVEAQRSKGKLTARERIDLLTRENLRETFRKYFPLDRRSVVTLLPEAGMGSGGGATPGVR